MSVDHGACTDFQRHYPSADSTDSQYPQSHQPTLQRVHWVALPELERHRREQPPLAGNDGLAGIEEQKGARPVGGFGLPRLEARLPEERRLLVAQHTLGRAVDVGVFFCTWGLAG